MNVPGKLTFGVDVRARRAPATGSGFVVLTRGGETRRFPYWFRVSVPRLGSESRRCCAGRASTTATPAAGPRAVSSYRYPSAPGPLGVTQRLPAPSRSSASCIRGRVANAGAVVVSQAPGSHVSPRLVRAGSEDRLAGYTALPLRLNPYQRGLLRADPGRRRLPPGARHLRPGLRHRQPPRAGPFTFRFWVNDTSPPAVRLLTRTVTRGKLLLLSVRDRGSGVDPSTLLAGSTAASTRSSGTRRTASSASGSRASPAAATSWASPSPTTRRRRTTRTRARRCRTRGADATFERSLVPAVEVFDRRKLVEVALDAGGEVVGLAAQNAQL